MGVLNTVVQTVKKNFTKNEILIAGERKQIFHYLHIDGSFSKLCTLSALIFKKNEYQSFFGTFINDGINNVEKFVSYFVTFDLSTLLTRFLAEKKEVLLNVLVDFLHADYLFYKFDEELLCNIKLRNVTVIYKNKTKSYPLDLTLDLKWIDDDFFIFSPENIQPEIRKIICSRATNKEISFTAFTNKCAYEYLKLNEHENFISKYEDIKKLNINLKENSENGISFKELHSWLEKTRNLSEEIIILLPIESLILKYHMANIIYSFSKLKKNNSVRYNSIKKILIIIVENFNFYENSYTSVNFLINLNIYILSIKYDNFVELVKSFGELSNRSLSTKANMICKDLAYELFRSYKESYIDLINVILVYCQSYLLEESFLKRYYLSKKNLTKLSLKDLNILILFIYQYSLLIEEKNTTHDLNLVNKQCNFFEKNSYRIEIQYLDRLGLDIKEELKELLIVPREVTTLVEFFDANQSLKSIYRKIKKNININKIDLKEKLFRFINKLIVLNNVSLHALHIIYQWIRVENNLTNAGDDILSLTTFDVTYQSESVANKLSLPAACQENNLPFKPEKIEKINSIKIRKQKQNKSSWSPINATKDKFTFKAFKINANSKEKLSLEEITSLKKLILDNLCLGNFNKKTSLNFENLMPSRYFSIPLRTKNLIDNFCFEINCQLYTIDSFHRRLTECKQQIKASKLRQIYICKKFQISLRAFLLEVDIFIYNQKQVEAKYKASYKFSFMFNHSMFERIKRGFFCKDNYYLNKLTNNIAFDTEEADDFSLFCKKRLLKISWIDLIIKYKFIRWPWESKSAFVGRFVEYICLNRYLNQIQLIETLNNKLKIQVKFLDPTKTSIHTAENLIKLVYQIKALEEVIFKKENKKLSVHMQKRYVVFENLDKLNLMLCEKIKNLLEKTDRLKNLESKSHQIALIYVEQFAESLKNESKVITHASSTFFNEPNNILPHSLLKDSATYNSNEQSFNFSI